MILNIMILKRLIRLNQYHVPFFWNHVKQNDTKTKSKRNDDSDGFWNHAKQNDTKTTLMNRSHV